jgi:hypothetical protein
MSNVCQLIKGNVSLIMVMYTGGNGSSSETSPR